MKHWFAAIWFTVFATLISVFTIALAGYLLYLVATEFSTFAATIGALLLFGFTTQWACDFIDEQGWPWRPKHPNGDGNAKAP